MSIINSKQAKDLSTLVNYNFLVSIVAIYTDYTQIKISFASEDCLQWISNRCKCKTESTWDGTYIFTKIYNN